MVGVFYKSDDSKEREIVKSSKRQQVSTKSSSKVQDLIDGSQR